MFLITTNVNCLYSSAPWSCFTSAARTSSTCAVNDFSIRIISATSIFCTTAEVPISGFFAAASRAGMAAGAVFALAVVSCEAPACFDGRLDAVDSSAEGTRTFPDDLRVCFLLVLLTATFVFLSFC